MTRAEQNQPKRLMGCHRLFEFAAHWVCSDPRWSVIGIIRWINQNAEPWNREVLQRAAQQTVWDASRRI